MPEPVRAARRLWIRTRTNDEGTAIEVAGLDRADARTGLSEHVDELTAAATGTATEEKK